MDAHLRMPPPPRAAHRLDRASTLLAAAIVALALAGCGQAPVAPRDQSPAPESLVWPKPPATARVRFVRSVETPADWGLSGGGFQRLIDKLTGQTPFRFVRPTGVAARGKVLYVADPGAQALVIFDPADGREHKLTRIGEENLASPVAVALGPGDAVFLVDSALRKVFVVDGQGQLQRTIGGEGRLARPAGVAYDLARDRLYVSDAAMHRIIVFSADGRMQESFGSNGNAPGEFNFPTHLALTPDGDLLVSDTLNFRVQILRRDGHPLGSFGRVGDGSGDFASPKGVGADTSGNIYVVDALFDAVQVFARDGSLQLGFGERGTRPGRFWLPNGLFIDPKDAIYVADSYNQRISVFQRVAPGQSSDEAPK
jgi:DNA-binding beta-propeller fold protein YncE